MPGIQTGNGFRFDQYDTNALRWAVDQAMEFYELRHEMKISQIRRVMLESIK
jgi:starch synthase/alpha-amylase